MIFYFDHGTHTLNGANSDCLVVCVCGKHLKVVKGLNLYIFALRVQVELVNCGDTGAGLVPVGIPVGKSAKMTIFISLAHLHNVKGA